MCLHIEKQCKGVQRASGPFGGVQGQSPCLLFAEAAGLWLDKLKKVFRFHDDRLCLHPAVECGALVKEDLVIEKCFEV